MMMACAGRSDLYQVAWSYANIEKGYDHDHRVDVYVDGVKVAESPREPQSAPGKLQVPVPPGAHEVRVVDLAYYEGQWEEHSIANEYSIDASWTGNARPGGRLELKFDLDQGTVVVGEKP
jgi:hypothetical protein